MPPESSSSRPEPRKQEIPDSHIHNTAPVARIMKMALPENAKIAKEAKECMQECVSEFISFITSEASEKCHVEKRKTVNGEDILFAMTSLGFENYAEVLKIYLSKYRETQSTRSENRPGSQGLGSSAVSGTLNVSTNTNAPSIFSGSDEPNNTAVAGVTGPEESKQESGFGGI
ncbi:Nuclear transcription factor Y subunit beta [Golovinomyces cichoracearum]|uniref:Nuclear transcription factor Y subunit beta n=1 Tax=Golovinomyces cichoracearum TaxID=62708 RepID=A0A420IM26_9PEZI|nr:Nuclear transcription factor Y subunit beta [Golovinomyces cichoracearum]